MNLKAMFLSFSLAIAPMSMAQQQMSPHHPPEDFRDLFDSPNADINIDMLYIENEIASMLDRTNLSLENQKLLGQAILRVIDEASKSRIISTWKAAFDLRQVCLDIRAEIYANEEPRLVFDYLITIVQLIIAVQEANLAGLIDTIATVIFGVVSSFFN